MTTEERKILTCKSCDEINDPGMLFCIHCGKGLTASAEKIRSNTTTTGGKCPACGQQDELNMRFCIFCSSPMVLDNTSQRPIDKFSWEMELADNGQPKAVTSAAIKFKDAVQKSPTKKIINYLPIGLGVGAVLGFLALLPYAQDLVKRTYLSGAWPKKSLTIYTKHPFAEVTIYEPSDAKVFSLAETDAKGAVRFNNLEPGDYNIKITGNGLRTGFQQISINGDNPAVIGYGDDKVVELERIPNVVHDDSAPNAAHEDAAPNAAHEDVAPNAAHEENAPKPESPKPETAKPESPLSPASTEAVEPGQLPTPEIIPLSVKSKSNSIPKSDSSDTIQAKPESNPTSTTESKTGTTESRSTGTPESNPAEKL